LQSLAPTNPHWARVVGYGPFSLWVIHKEGLCPSSGDINRLMMMMMINFEHKSQNFTLSDGRYYIMVNGDLPFNINTHLLLPFAVVVVLCLLIILIFMVRFAY
jgi:hypothetical protein